MTAIYAPGRDRVEAPPTYSPRDGAGGQFARDIQGATPKYAVNTGRVREPFNKNTLARLFIRINPSESSLFLSSIADVHTRTQLVPQLVGDLSSQRRRGEGIAGTGYVDFFLNQVQRTFQEKVQVTEVLSDNYVAFTFGMAPPVWTFQGTLLNTVQDDQASNFTSLYLHILRATQLARRQKVVSIRYDDSIVTGIFLGFSDQLQSGQEASKPFQFQLLVKKLACTNYTSGWRPTQPEGVFAADPNAVPFDSQVREEGATMNFTGLTPAGMVLGPGRDANTDPRCVTPAQSQDATEAPRSVAQPPVRPAMPTGPELMSRLNNPLRPESMPVTVREIGT